MSQEVRAIYENGLFRSLGPVAIAEHDIVTLVVGPASSQACECDEELNRQRTALAEMFEEADRLPRESPGYAFSGVDHDLVLYGWKKWCSSIPAHGLPLMCPRRRSTALCRRRWQPLIA